VYVADIYARAREGHVSESELTSVAGPGGSLGVGGVVECVVSVGVTAHTSDVLKTSAKLAQITRVLYAKKRRWTAKIVELLQVLESSNVHFVNDETTLRDYSPELNRWTPLHALVATHDAPSLVERRC